LNNFKNTSAFLLRDARLKPQQESGLSVPFPVKDTEIPDSFICIHTELIQLLYHTIETVI